MRGQENRSGQTPEKSAEPERETEVLFCCRPWQFVSDPYHFVAKSLPCAP